ncbi:hypothetical protein RM545_07690 [Zunongwangia sp. F260]|uniref:Uncharacterized protein n=1 Tax=Autumnicola lenta TaxID=3075593 RepID=A0ABU3CJN4_9FLAO|nr:hypothetical protein [Zunongwangia sp. F260]MDT0646567.1 hypothetical protein [Zunongwangia sp. F260]
MKEKEIKIELEKGVRNGVSKTDLYNHFKDQYDDDSLRLLLASKPSLANRKKYKILHLILSGIWGIFLAFELLSVLELIDEFDIRLFASIIITFYFTINIWNFDGKFFLPGIIWFIISIFNSFKEISVLPEYDPDLYILQNITFGYSFMLIMDTHLCLL